MCEHKTEFGHTENSTARDVFWKPEQQTQYGTASAKFPHVQQHWTDLCTVPTGQVLEHLMHNPRARGYPARLVKSTIRTFRLRCHTLTLTISIGQRAISAKNSAEAAARRKTAPRYKNAASSPDRFVRFGSRSIDEHEINIGDAEQQC